MGDVVVKRAKMDGEQIDKLAVELHGLGERVIDRDTALSWLRDGHSLIPVIEGQRRPALQLVELEDGHAIRTDNQAEAADALPPLPSL